MPRFRLMLVLSCLVLSLSLLLPVGAADKLPDQPIAPGKPSAVPRGDDAFKTDVEAYRKLVTDLAAPEMEGRGPATKGLDLARDYIVNEFKQLKLEPAFRASKDAAPSFTQEFIINAGVRVKTQSLVLLDKEGKELLAPKVTEHYEVRGFSGDGKVSAPAVFVGYAVVDKERGYDSFGEDKELLKGKIAVAYRYEPVDGENKPILMKDGKPGQITDASNLMFKAKWAAERGAAALVVVDPPSRDKSGPLPNVLETQSGTAAAIPVMQIKPEVFRHMLRTAGLGDEQGAKDLEKQANDGTLLPKALTGVQLAVEAKLDRITAPIHNVGGVLPGTGALKDQYIVVGGHYDHLGHGGAGALGPSGGKNIYHGADDNASGTAGVILIARNFAEFAQAPGQGADRRSMLFVCFSGEERGLLGSMHMLRKIDELGIKPEQMVAMINLDMIGRMGENKLYAMGVESGEGLAAIMAEAAKGLDLKMETSTSVVGGSDHQSFHAKKIPAIHFFSGVHRDYHKPTDTADKINSEGGVKTVDVCSRIALALWNSGEPIKYIPVRPAHPTAGGPRGSGAFLGVLPDYQENDGKGCLINGTTDGSPAAAAGLKEGDVITAWDKTPITDIQTLTDALRASKAGQEITLKLKREGKEMEIKVKLGTR